MSEKQEFEALMKEIRQCTICKEHLPLGPNPIVSGSPSARMLIIGQAPGTKAHNSSIAFKDASGKRLREWLGVDEAIFYDPEIMAIMPMGFCYPGKGKSGDLPPRKECALTYHERFTSHLTNLNVTLLIGQYAQKYYLKGTRKKNLTATVRAFEDYLPEYFPLPHPSPLNLRWLSRNKWFETDVLPVLKQIVQSNLSESNS